MEDKSRVVQCPYCEKVLLYKLVRVKCPYCDKTMVFSLPEYEFYDGVVGCEHCYRKSRLQIGGYYQHYLGKAIAMSKPVWENGRLRIQGGRLLSIEPEVSGELTLSASDKIPDGPRQDLQSAVRCLEIREYLATAMLCRRCIQSALKLKGIPEDTPAKMINTARQQNMLSELARKQSDAVTFMGNKAAHPHTDPLLDLREPDVRQGLQMVRRILLELFDPDQLDVF